MVVVSNYNLTTFRKERDHNWICLILEVILTFLFIKIPYFDTLRTACGEYSTVQTVNVANLFCMASQVHQSVNGGLRFINFNATDENIFGVPQGIYIISNPVNLGYHI